MYTIDKDKCKGCGACTNVCPNEIKIVDGKAVIKEQNEECLKKAAEICPVNIIVNNKD